MNDGVECDEAAEATNPDASRPCDTMGGCPGKNIWKETISSFLEILMKINTFLVDCLWGTWDAWTSCTDSCAARDGAGDQTRMREIAREAMNEGVECTEPNTDSQSCATVCPGKEMVLFCKIQTCSSTY